MRDSVFYLLLFITFLDFFCLVQLRGPLMATNFAISNYAKAIKVFYEENPEAVESNESAKSAEEKKTTNKSSTTKSTSSSKIKAQKL
jgi:hypothetical protein